VYKNNFLFEENRSKVAWNMAFGVGYVRDITRFQILKIEALEWNFFEIWQTIFMKLIAQYQHVW